MIPFYTEKTLRFHSVLVWYFMVSYQRQFYITTIGVLFLSLRFQRTSLVESVFSEGKYMAKFQIMWQDIQRALSERGLGIKIRWGKVVSSFENLNRLTAQMIKSHCMAAWPSLSTRKQNKTKQPRWIPRKWNWQLMLNVIIPGSEELIKLTKVK